MGDKCVRSRQASFSTTGRLWQTSCIRIYWQRIESQPGICGSPKRVGDLHPAGRYGRLLSGERLSFQAPLHDRESSIFNRGLLMNQIKFIVCLLALMSQLAWAQPVCVEPQPDCSTVWTENANKSKPSDGKPAGTAITQGAFMAECKAIAGELCKRWEVFATTYCQAPSPYIENGQCNFWRWGMEREHSKKMEELKKKLP